MGQHCIDALALDDPLEYTRLILDGEMQTWVNEQDTFEIYMDISRSDKQIRF